MWWTVTTPTCFEPDPGAVLGWRTCSADPFQENGVGAEEVRRHQSLQPAPWPLRRGWLRIHAAGREPAHKRGKPPRRREILIARRHHALNPGDPEPRSTRFSNPIRLLTASWNRGKDQCPSADRFMSHGQRESCCQPTVAHRYFCLLARQTSNITPRADCVRFSECGHCG